MNLLAIDPGINGLGYAVFRGARLVIADSIYPKKRNSNVETVSVELARKVYRIAKRYNPSFAVIEFPVFYPVGSGYASAVTGALLKLTYSAGVIQGYFRGKIPFAAPNVREYKGQLPKHVVKKRVDVMLESRTSKIKSKASHAWDAVYLGMWYLSPRADKWKVERGIK